MAEDLSEDEQFRSIVLGLKKLNPSWTASKIYNELKSYENAPKLRRASLVRKINKILKRGTVKNKPGQGRVVKKLLRL